MIRTVTRPLAAVVMTIALGAQGVGAQAPAAANKGPNHADDKGRDTNTGAVSRLNEALALVSYARENESPTAMLTAVQMMRGVRAEDSAQRLGTKTNEPAAADASAAPGKKAETPAPTLDATALLNEAKGWARGNAQLIALIDAELARPAAAANSGTLGSASGATRHVDRVLARQKDIYRVRFVGGELAKIGVIGDGDTDLDLYVRDEFGNEIARDDDRTDRCYVQWTPKWTGVFTIEVHNLGRVYNDYTLMTN
jgi:hypothetical protein